MIRDEEFGEHKHWNVCRWYDEKRQLKTEIYRFLISKIFLRKILAMAQVMMIGDKLRFIPSTQLVFYSTEKGSV